MSSLSEPATCSAETIFAIRKSTCAKVWMSMVSPSVASAGASPGATADALPAPAFVLLGDAAALLEALEVLAAVEVNAALFELLRVPVPVVHEEAEKVFVFTAVPVACEDCDCFAEPLLANVADAEAEPVTDTVAERVSRALGEVEELPVALRDGSALLERTPLTVAVPLGLLLKLT